MEAAVDRRSDRAMIGRRSDDAPPILSHVQAGAGEDVVLVHGALATAADMEIALLPVLSRRYRVTAFDRAGHEVVSRTRPAGGSPRAHARRLRDSIRAIGLKRPVIVGHSFGGAVALTYALQYPDEVAGIVAVAPIVFPEPRLEHVLFAPRSVPGIGFGVNMFASFFLDPFLLPMIRRIMFSPQEVPEGYDARVRGSAPDAMLLPEGDDAALMVPGLALNSVLYARCRVPVAVVAGAADRIVDNRRHGKVLPTLMRNASYVELPGIGHMAHHFGQAEILRAITHVTSR